MVSMNVGAGQGARAKKCTVTGCVASMITAVLIISIIVPASSHLTTLFTRQQDVLEIANHALHIYTYSGAAADDIRPRRPFFFYFPELMVNLFLLIDRFACQIDAQLLEDLRIHVGEQDGSVNFAAL